MEIWFEFYVWYCFQDKHSFLFVSRFNVGDVEQRAKSVDTSLEKKQERKRPPKAEKEAHVMANKLRKVKKSIEKQKTLYVFKHISG